PGDSVDRSNTYYKVYLSSTSPAGIRFLASIKQGNGLKPSARAAGIGKSIIPATKGWRCVQLGLHRDPWISVFPALLRRASVSVSLLQG
ncbi:hypothetical protein, partial [Priestia megaterium]|uniref:hypothetical protein n=1 Tax=Priestia megaterium TaxID=1404 RepID=UPI0035B5EC39